MCSFLRLVCSDPLHHSVPGSPGIEDTKVLPWGDHFGEGLVVGRGVPLSGSLSPTPTPSILGHRSGVCQVRIKMGSRKGFLIDQGGAPRPELRVPLMMMLLGDQRRGSEQAGGRWSRGSARRGTSLRLEEPQAPRLASIYEWWPVAPWPGGWSLCRGQQQVAARVGRERSRGYKAWPANLSPQDSVSPFFWGPQLSHLYNDVVSAALVWFCNICCVPVGLVLWPGLSGGGSRQGPLRVVWAVMDGSPGAGGAL